MPLSDIGATLTTVQSASTYVFNKYDWESYIQFNGTSNNGNYILSFSNSVKAYVFLVGGGGGGGYAISTYEGAGGGDVNRMRGEMPFYCMNRIRLTGFLPNLFCLP